MRQRGVLGVLEGHPLSGLCESKKVLGKFWGLVMKGISRQSRSC